MASALWWQGACADRTRTRRVGRVAENRTLTFRSRSVWRFERTQIGDHLRNRHNVGILYGHIIEIGEMRALVLVGHAFLGNHGAVAVREAVDNSGAHTARRGTARDNEGVTAMESEQRGEVGLMEG